MTHEMVQLQPNDQHNQELGSNVHPLDWTNPTPTEPYHLVVIGAGTAGLVTAAGAAGLGARVALIERELMGGDCLNVGCVPSKGVIRAARVAATVRDAEPFGINVSGDTSFDFAKAMERMRRLRAQISPADSAKRFSDLGVDVYFGQGSFAGDDKVNVTRADGSVTELQFRKAVIATGARASAPPIRPDASRQHGWRRAGAAGVRGEWPLRGQRGASAPLRWGRGPERALPDPGGARVRPCY